MNQRLSLEEHIKLLSSEKLYTHHNIGMAGRMMLKIISMPMSFPANDSTCWNILCKLSTYLDISPKNLFRMTYLDLVVAINQMPRSTKGEREKYKETVLQTAMLLKTMADAKEEYRAKKTAETAH